MYKYLLIFIFLLLPQFSQAAVIINEVAWMGDLESANHEWIELYNNGTAEVSVDGWVLGDGVNLQINLSGSIPASTYVVLERTSEESSPVGAFLLYTGALVNTGATLTLKNPNGEIMDQVVGGENWQEIGGDNTSKETAQYTSQGWVTDIATPKAQNKNGRVETSTGESNNSSDIKEDEKPRVSMFKSGGKTKSLSLVTSNSVLKLETEMQDVAYVNQTVPFLVTSYGAGDTIMASLNYVWNFGDSYEAQGKKVEHSYKYPGTYVVTINAKYARHNETIRREITILPVSFSITENENGDIQIHNDSPYDVDISGFSVKGDKEIFLPERSIILPKATITITKSRLGNGENLIVLYDNKNNPVASNFLKLQSEQIQIEDTIDVEKVAKVVYSNKISDKITNPKTTTSNTLLKGIVTNEVLAAETIYSTSSNEDLNVEVKTDNKSSEEDKKSWTYIGLVLLIITALLALRYGRR